VEGRLNEKVGEGGEWDNLRDRLAREKQEKRLQPDATGTLDNPVLGEAAQRLGVVLPSDAAVQRTGPAIYERAEEIFTLVKRRFASQGVEEWETYNLEASTRLKGADGYAPHLRNTSGGGARGLFPVFHADVEGYPKGKGMSEEQFQAHLAALQEIPPTAGVVVESVLRGPDRRYLEEVLNSAIGEAFRGVFELSKLEVKLLARVLGMTEQEVAEQGGDRGLNLDELRSHPFGQHSIAGVWGKEIPVTREGKQQAADQFMFSAAQLANRAAVVGRIPRAVERYHEDRTPQGLLESLQFLLEPLGAYTYDRSKFDFAADLSTVLTTGKALPGSPLAKRVTSTLRILKGEPAFEPLEQALASAYPALAEAGLEEERLAVSPSELQARKGRLPSAPAETSPVGILAGPDPTGLAVGWALDGKMTPAVAYVVESPRLAAGLEELGVRRNVIFLIGAAKTPTLEAAVAAARNLIAVVWGVSNVVELGTRGPVNPNLRQVLSDLWVNGQLTPESLAVLQSVIEQLLGAFSQMA